MEDKKLRIKHGATLKDSYIVIIGFIMAFGIFVTFITHEASVANVTVDPSFNQSYSALQADQQGLQNTTNDLLSALSNVSEAKAGDFAYFGLKGMWAVFKTPFQILNIASDSVGVTSPLFGFLPPELKGGIVLIIIGIVVFAGVRFATSRNNDP